MYHWLTADQVILWTRLVLASCVALVVAPFLATRDLVPQAHASVGDPYRDAVGPSAGVPEGSRVRGSLLLLAGTVHLLLVPIGLVAAFLQSFSLAPGGGDGPGTVVIFVAAVGAAPTAVTLLRAGLATLRARPCTRINAAALVSVEGVLTGAAVFAIGRETSVVIAGAAGLGVLLVWIGLAALVLRAVPTAADDTTVARARRLVVLSNLSLAFVLGAGGAFALWVGGELGDRLSNVRTPEDASWYLAVQLPTFVLGGVLVLFCVVDVALAVAAARGGRRARGP